MKWLLLLLLGGCAAADRESRQADWRVYTESYQRLCVPMYALARTPHDSLLVHLHRPYSLYPTCWEIAHPRV